MIKRMAHGFEVDGPFQDFEQFRKEIGKSIDKNKVARFERYVTLM